MKQKTSWIGLIGATLVGANPESLNKLADITKIPRHHKEVELKFLLAKPGDPIDLIETHFVAQIAKFVKDADRPKMTTFSGIDHYFLVRPKGIKLNIRYRTGMNRAPQITLKLKGGTSTQVRPEININVGDTHPESVNLFISALAGSIDPKTKVFAVKGVGNIWVFEDRAGRIEFVVYRYEILGRPETAHVFLEIEALDGNDVATAVRQVEHFEKVLGVKKFRCDHSVADIFSAF